jgi:hypothetical protein
MTKAPLDAADGITLTEIGFPPIRSTLQIADAPGVVLTAVVSVVEKSGMAFSNCFFLPVESTAY